MILWTLVICAVMGFVLGTQARLIALAATSALIAALAIAGVPLVPHEPHPGAASMMMTTVTLIVVLQAFFLAGAGWRVFCPRFLLPGSRAAADHGVHLPGASRLGAATALDSHADVSIDGPRDRLR
jgi:hypothetical protein